MIEPIPSLKSMLDQLKSHWLRKKASLHQKHKKFPRFHQLLDYRYYDQAKGMFVQTHSIGIGWVCQPKAGVDEAFIDHLHDSLNDGLPDEAIIECWLIARPQIDTLLKKGLEKSDQLPFLSHFQSTYANAAHIGPLLRDYQLVIAISLPAVSQEKIRGLFELKETFEAMLSSLHLAYQRLAVEDLMRIVDDLLTLSADQREEKNFSYDPYLPLNEQMVSPDLEYLEEIDCLKRTLQQNGQLKKSVVQVLGIQHTPQRFALYQMADLFSPIFKRQHQIRSPFVIAWKMKKLPMEKMKAIAGRRYRQSEEGVQKGLKKWFAKMDHQATEWAHIREQLDTQQTQLVKMDFSFLLFSEEGRAVQEREAVLSAFKLSGIKLMANRYLQKVRYLSSFPFLTAGSLWEDLTLAHTPKTLTSFNAINFMPLLADVKLSKKGILLPTFRHQLTFFDPFDERLPTTNFNCAISGVTGSGKSFLVNALVLHTYLSQGVIFIIDKGESYKNLSQLLGGTYLRAENLALNPFTFVNDIEKEAEGIRDLLSVMASPHQPLDQIQQEYLREAILTAFAQHQKKTHIDSVVEQLSLKGKKVSDQRLTDLIILLKRYTRSGNYGFIFNEASRLATDQRLIVLELGGLSKTPQLLKAVLFALILKIQSTIANLPRAVKKMVVLDEAWQFLSGENQVEGKFFEEQARTFRKHRASLVTITQGLEDYQASSASRAIFANAGIKCMLLQSLTGLEKFLSERPAQSSPYFDAYSESVLKTFGPAKRQGFSEVLLELGQYRSFHRFYADPFSKILFSSHAKEFETVQSFILKGLSLDRAVLEAAKIFYEDETHAVLKALNKEKA